MANKELDGMMKKLMAKSKRDLEEKKKRAPVDKALDELTLDQFAKTKSQYSGELSDEQVKNWREILCGILGPYAVIMPKEEIQKIKDKMQENLELLNEQDNDD